jgi:alkylation response protein AidB-like acyl-CoA dehydrogenase
MDYAKEFVQERRQFDQAIADFQGIQWMIADAYTELEAARLLIMQAASLKEAGQPYVMQASMAKLYASEKANQACNTALQLLGGAGYLVDHPVERFVRDARITTIYEGTSQIQKVIISKNLLASAIKR